MIPQPEQHVKCILKTGTLVEGIVQNWAPDGVVLKSLDGESLLIIHHPDADIVLTKIVLLSEKIVEQSTPVSQDLQQEFEQTLSEENIVDVRSQSLVELQKLKAQQDRKILVSKLRDHHLGQTQEVKYEQPGLRALRRPQ